MVPNAADADLLGLGSLCAVPTCGVRDLLPFRCACGAVTCGAHRADHGCRLPAPGSDRVAVCPICAKAIRLPPGAAASDEAAVARAFDEHQRSKV